MKALIVVDCQQDFMPGGALAVPHGDEVVPVINKLLPKFDLVIFTKDWHTEDNIGFASQHDLNPFDKLFNGDTVWPDHCIQNTPGADLHPGIDLALCKKDFYIFKKGDKPEAHPYSGFGEFKESDPEGLFNELGIFLDEKDVDEIFVCGLAGDFCVKETVLDAANTYLYETNVIIDACRSIGDIEPVLTEFSANSRITIINSEQI